MRDARKALVLQGGGALGAYQAGVYAALSETALQPHWIAGVSIGAINAALIAGNAPEQRVEKLREFWHLVSSGPSQRLPSWLGDRATQNQWSATMASLVGIPGFFEPRYSPALLMGGAAPLLSYYDTSALKTTLERLVDFDRINACEARFSVGAVNVRTGNSVYFDNTRQRIGPEHIMASGALPPGFAPMHHRRRRLLGRRHRLEHAAAVRARHAPALRAAGGAAGRPVQRARRNAAHASRA
jgi:NTE family protein